MEASLSRNLCLLCYRGFNEWCKLLFSCGYNRRRRNDKVLRADLKGRGLITSHSVEVLGGWLRAPYLSFSNDQFIVIVTLHAI